MIIRWYWISQMKAAIELLAAIPESKAARENVQVNGAFWKIFCKNKM